MGQFYAERRSPAAAATKAIIVSKLNAHPVQNIVILYMGYGRQEADVPW
jgi:hypothetical protein